MKNNKEGFKLIDAEEDGKAISPVLPNEVKNYMIDIDGTVCYTKNSDYINIHC